MYARTAEQYAHMQDLADREAQAQNDALESMRANPSYVDDFICSPSHDLPLSKLLALFLDNGTPARQRTIQSMNLVSKYETLRDEFLAKFEAWARGNGDNNSPLARFMGESVDVHA